MCMVSKIIERIRIRIRNQNADPDPRKRWGSGSATPSTVNINNLRLCRKGLILLEKLVGVSKFPHESFDPREASNLSP